jgi:hypothetical protein
LADQSREWRGSAELGRASGRATEAKKKGSETEE